MPAEGRNYITKIKPYRYIFKIMAVVVVYEYNYIYYAAL